MIRQALPNRSNAKTRPVRICYVIDRLSAAGTERQLLSLIERLDRSLVEPHLCLLDGDDDASRELLPADCPALCLGVRKLRHWRSLVQARRFSAFLRDREIDVVQTHFPDSTYFAVPLARLAGAARVVRTRRDLGYWMRPVDRLLGRWLNRLCVDATIANCEACRRSVIADEGAPADRVVVLENGIALSEFEDIAELRATTHVRRVGMVANLRPVKDPELFVRAGVEICRRQRDVEFHLAGQGELEPRLRRMIAAAGLADRIVLHGPVADPAQFLAGIEIAVLCSCSEGLSNAILEYMAAGRAIVATRVGGTPELIEHERTGLLIEPGNERQLVASLERLLGNAPLAARLGDSARAAARDRFDWSIAAERTTQFYYQLLGRPLPAATGRTPTALSLSNVSQPQAACV